MARALREERVRPPVLSGESLEPRELLLLYTDGLTEARHPDGQMFTVPGLGELTA